MTDVTLGMIEAFHDSVSEGDEPNAGIRAAIDAMTDEQVEELYLNRVARHMEQFPEKRIDPL